MALMAAVFILFQASAYQAALLPTGWSRVRRARQGFINLSMRSPLVSSAPETPPPGSADPELSKIAGV